MSFQQGLSGLNAANSNLAAIGNNVANANTVGFKQSQAQFADMFAASISGSGGASGQIGTGVSVAAVAQQFTQGNVTATSNPMDTAISGQGFFLLTNSAGATAYSRNGQFQLDKNGFLVNAQGNQLNGYMPNAAGAILAGATVPLQINPANLQPKGSALVTVGANLNSAAPVPATAVFNATDPTSYTNSTSLTVYDSLGASHVGTLYFQRQPITTVGNGSFAAANNTMTVGSTTGLSVGNTVTLAGVTYTITGVTNGTTLAVTPAAAAPVAAAPTTTNAPSSSWNTYLTVDGVSVPTAGTALTQLTFNSLGALSSTNPVSTPIGSVASSALFPTSTAVSNTQTITFNFGSQTAATTQYGSAFGVNTLTQDGYASGQLNSTSTGADGTITGRYSNGQTRPLAQIVLANFTSPQGLQSVGNNEWVQTAASGAPLVGAPGASSLGTLQSSAVEDSNVDLTAALVNMITAQRVYQANAQTIKTQDQLLQTVVNLR